MCFAGAWVEDIASCMDSIVRGNGNNHIISFTAGGNDLSDVGLIAGLAVKGQ